MIKKPDLRGNILAGSDEEKFHTLSVSGVKTLFGHFVDNFPLLNGIFSRHIHMYFSDAHLGMGPLLVPALTVAVGHLNFLPGGGEGVGHHGAAVLPPQLKQPGEGEELGRGHEVVTHVLAQVVAANTISNYINENTKNYSLS